MPNERQSAEDWAWEKIRAGEIADFNSKFGEVDPSEPDGRWNDDRKIGARFLRRILFEMPYRDEIPIEGIRVVGAFLPEGQMLQFGRANRNVSLRKCRSEKSIDFRDTTFEGYLSLECCWLGSQADSASLGLVHSQIWKSFNLGSAIIDGEMDLRGAKICRDFYIAGSVFEKALRGDRLQVDGNLFMDKQSKFKSDVILRGASVSGQLYMTGALFEKTLNGAYLQVGQDMFMDEHATFKDDVILQGASVSGGLYMTGALFEKTLNGRDLQVGRDMLMNQQATFKDDVILNRASVSGQLQMTGALFEKTLNGRDLQVGQDMLMNQQATFKDDVILNRASVSGRLYMTGALFEKTVNGRGLQVGQDMFMDEPTTFKDDVILNRASVSGRLYMTGALFEKTLNCGSLQVGRDMLLDQQATFKGNVTLLGASVSGGLYMTGALFEKTLNCDSLQVGQEMFMNQPATFKGDVNLIGASVSGQLQMTGALFEKTLNCGGLQVGREMLMNQQATFKGNVTLLGASVSGGLYMTGALFEKTLNGAYLQVGGLYMIDAIFKKPALLPFARVGTDLSLSGATLAGLDLTGAKITQDLSLTILGKQVVWSAPNQGLAYIILRNTQAGALQDSPDAWPPVADLEGFSYGRVGGFGSTGADDARTRAIKDWQNWLATDGGSSRHYSAQPYVQLAGVLAAAGRRDHANAILFAGRQRERSVALQDHRWLRWLWLSWLSWICGYGIGIYTFRVLWWIIGSILVGTAVLWFGAPVASHEKGPLWCAAASIDQLLPIIHLNKEFGDFFNDPHRTRLTGYVAAFFCVLQLWGWVLGSFLIAAVSGLTQRS